MTYEDTEKLLEEYFLNVRKLRIWKNSIETSQKQIQSLTDNLKALEDLSFDYDIKAVTLQEFTPSNRQPAKGIDSIIDKQAALKDKMQGQIEDLRLDILSAYGKVAELEPKICIMAGVLEHQEREAQLILKYKYQDKMVFDQIGELLRKSTTAAHDYYKRVVTDIQKWLNYLDY